MTDTSPMITLFTDFGLTGPYTGQMKAVLACRAPGIPVIDLFSDAPAFSVKASSCLLAAYMEIFPSDTVFLSIIDPGVGSARLPIAVRAFEKWFVGPDNGLFEHIIRRADRVEAYEIISDQASVSVSFHGRDIFAPVAAALAMGDMPASMTPISTARLVRPDGPDDLAEIIYIDGYGNCMTGIRAGHFQQKEIFVGGTAVPGATCFSDVAAGKPLIYANANGLMEIAVNQGRADRQLGLSVGAALDVTVR